MSNDKTFVNGIVIKEVTFQDGGMLLNVSLQLEDNTKNGKTYQGFAKFANAHKKDGWLNITMKKSQKTNDWYAELNTYSKNQQQTPQSEAPIEQAPDDYSDDIPF